MARASSARKRKNRFLSLLVMLATLVFLCYAVGSLISYQVEISKQRRQLAEIKEQTMVALEENNELDGLLGAEDNSEYIERIAREKLGYAYDDERVYYVIPAN